MNKKGFTLVELITTFALVTVIIILLTNVILVLKNLYTTYDIKTKLLIDQGDLSYILNSKINDSVSVSYNGECTIDNEYCYSFIFDSEDIKLVISDKYIKFGSYVYTISEGTEIEELEDSEQYVSVKTDGTHEFLIIKIPIKNKLYPNEEFGVNVVYPIN